MGIAKKLLIVSLRDAINNGLRLATLEVRANNLIAQKLYAEFGFTVAGRRPRYYRDNDEDALIMTLQRLGNEYLRWLEIVDRAEIVVECSDS
jgi:ribosomal-protein-alanine N-acetyltransferase